VSITQGLRLPCYQEGHSLTRCVLDKGLLRLVCSAAQSAAEPSGSEVSGLPALHPALEGGGDEAEAMGQAHGQAQPMRVAGSPMRTKKLLGAFLICVDLIIMTPAVHSLISHSIQLSDR